MPVEIRPMEPRDVPFVDDVATAAFEELNERVGRYPGQPVAPQAAAMRVARLLETDPGGAWVAEREGALCGVALGIVREGVWGLSLLAVRPEVQSAGLGRELLARARAHGNGARGFIVLGSRDARALRSYVRLGLDLHPAMHAIGRPRGVSAPGGIRPWRADDREWADDVGRAVRGAAHGGDLDAFAASGATIAVLPERGYAVARGADLKLLAAVDDDSARTLLQAHFAAAGEQTAIVSWLTSAQQWAIKSCVEAGLRLDASGAVLTGGELGPMRPYLPSGSYL